MRRAIGLADLAENFGFADEHGIETGRNAEEMTNGFAVVVMIERRAESFRRDRVERA